MNDNRMVKTSRILSRHLRHQPERLGLEVAPGGWVSVDDLLASCASHGLPITPAELAEVVARNDKQRFSFNEAGTHIRANQGHSIDVDLQLEPTTPPPTLYHGTGDRALASILDGGLRKMSRHHVHLTTDVPTARRIGARHGRPVVLAVDAATMTRAGYAFFISANGVWLVEAVPPEYLTPIVSA